MRTFFGVFGGAVIAAFLGVISEVAHRNIGAVRDDPFRFSALVPLAYGLLSFFLLLPIARALHLRGHEKTSIWLLPGVLAIAGSVTVALFPDEQNVFLLVVDTFICIAVPLWASGLVATRIWRAPN
jgi:hypothetical protein